MAMRTPNPNRMELLKLRVRLATSVKGHKLLKDKLDELMKVFLTLAEENAGLRAQVECALTRSYELYALAHASSMTDLPCAPEGDALAVTQKSRRVLNTELPVFHLAHEPQLPAYSLARSPVVLDEALETTRALLPDLLKLSEQEYALTLLGAELKATRRRVNALEHVLIPQLEGNIRTIIFKLDEANREERTRLLKIKDLLSTSAG